MISCEQRQAARDLTLPQLEQAGLSPRVFLSPCNPPGWKNNIRVGEEALAHAVSTGSEYVLFVEDDIDLSPVFPHVLNISMMSNHAVTYLYVHDRPDRGPKQYGKNLWEAINTGKPLNPTFVQAGVYGYLYGSQAVLMRRDYAIIAQAMTEQRTNATDTTLIKAWARTQTEVWISVPHVVQHRHDRTLREHQTERRPEWKRSRSYDRATSWQQSSVVKYDRKHEKKHASS